MTRIVLDAQSSKTLDALTHTVEVCDSAGRILGRFVPTAADDFNPREAYPFVDKTMADADAVDPTLASYQRYQSEAKP